MQKLFQVIGWLLALAIIVLSLGPPSIRPITAAGHGLEHLLMFLATGVAFALGYPRRFWLLAIALLAFAAAIEIAQIWVPGRHARLSDFIIDATVSCLGGWNNVPAGEIKSGYYARLTRERISHRPKLLWSYR
jgi:VanZ like family